MAEPIVAVNTAIDNKSPSGLGKAVAVERIISELHATTSRIMAVTGDADELEQYAKPR